jgi:hypothetical protein
MSSLRSLFAGRPVVFGLWVLLCAVALLGTLRLSVFMFDPARGSFSMLPGNAFLRAHSCLSAYVAAADRLGEPGASLYDPAGYERNGSDAERRIPLGAFFEQDAYEYPPTFLLLPKAFLLVSHRFAVLRGLWYVFMATAILGAMGFTAAWIGGREGLVTAVLIPALWGGFSNLLTVQMGNVQLVVVVLAILAMIAFDRGRPALGGAMLAFAIGTKLYPGLLLILLLTQRRWREALWTIGFGVLYCAGVLAIAGSAPFHEFVSYQLPRLLSGEAFDFFKERADAKLINNSMYGVPYKLEVLGLVRDPARLAPVLSRIYTVALVVLAVALGRKAPRPAVLESRAARAERAMVWMAIVNLGAMQSPFAPSYALLGTVWLLTLWASLGRSLGRTTALFIAGWVPLMIVIPEPRWVLAVFGVSGTLVNLGINVAALLWVLRARLSPAAAEPTREPASAST